MIFDVFSAQSWSRLGFVEPIRLLLKYGANINHLKTQRVHTPIRRTIFTDIIMKMLEYIIYGSRNYDKDKQLKQKRENLKLLKLFVSFGIDEYKGTPSYKEYIDEIPENRFKTEFLELYNEAKRKKLTMHAKQRSNFAKSIMLPENIMDTVFENFESNIPIGKTLYDNQDLLSNLDVYNKYDDQETYDMFMTKKNRHIRDSLRGDQLRPSHRKYAKKTYKNRKKYKRKY